MEDIQKLKYILSHIEEALDTMGHEGTLEVTTGLYGEDGHVGDDDEDVVGMLFIEEELSGAITRTWNVRVKLDD